MPDQSCWVMNATRFSCKGKGGEARTLVTAQLIGECHISNYLNLWADSEFNFMFHFMELKRGKKMLFGSSG